jgi:hypothetical protein
MSVRDRAAGLGTDPPVPSTRRAGRSETPTGRVMEQVTMQVAAPGQPTCRDGMVCWAARPRVLPGLAMTSAATSASRATVTVTVPLESTRAVLRRCRRSPPHRHPSRADRATALAHPDDADRRHARADTGHSGPVDSYAVSERTGAGMKMAVVRSPKHVRVHNLLATSTTAPYGGTHSSPLGRGFYFRLQRTRLGHRSSLRSHQPSRSDMYFHVQRLA